MSCDISVVMPVLNGDFNHLKEAIESILKQTFETFEFIIVDDGSNQETKDFLASYAQKDSRINIITNAENQGVGRSLNIGVDAAKGTYIARHDADDIAKPERFAKQFDYLQANPELAMCCTSVNHIDMQGNQIDRFAVSTDSDLLEAELLLNSRLCHPSLMLRTDALREVNGYPETKSAQDYLLYLTLVKHGKKLGGINEYLVDYRINVESITRKNRSKQLHNAETGSYEHVCNLVGKLDRASFSRFWYFIALQGASPLTIRDLQRIKPMLSLIKNNPAYTKAWKGEFSWISRKALSDNPGINTLLIALYFRFLF